MNPKAWSLKNYENGAVIKLIALFIMGMIKLEGLILAIVISLGVVVALSRYDKWRGE